MTLSLPTLMMIADKFADFFLNKIKKIKTDLESCPKFETQQRDCTILQNFAPVSEDEVQGIVCSMPRKFVN